MVSAWVGRRPAGAVGAGSGDWVSQREGRRSGKRKERKRRKGWKGEKRKEKGGSRQLL